MKNALLFLGLVLLTISPLSAQIKSLVFVTQDKQDFPWVIGDGRDFPADKPGVAVELLRAVAVKTGIAIEIKRYPWSRCLESELKNGTADGAFLASYKAEREAFGVYPQKDGKADPTRRVNTSTYSFYRLTSSTWNWDGKTIPADTGTVGIPEGYSIGDDLKKLGMTVHSFSNTETGLRNLLFGRVALVATLEHDGDFQIESNPAFKGKIEKVATPIVSKPYYIMLSKQFVSKDPETANKIWAAVAELRDSSLQGTLKKYF